jgi:hypothetical protein
MRMNFKQAAGRRLSPGWTRGPALFLGASYFHDSELAPGGTGFLERLVELRVLNG